MDILFILIYSKKHHVQYPVQYPYNVFKKEGSTGLPRIKFKICFIALIDVIVGLVIIDVFTLYSLLGKLE